MKSSQTTRYEYQAYDSKGQIVEDTIIAESKSAAVRLLQGRGLVPFSVDVVKENTQVFSKKKLSSRELIEFTEALSSLLDAQIPMDRALGMLSELSERPIGRQMITNLQKQVKEGQSLAEAMAEQPENFSRLYINMVRAGEHGGILSLVMQRLSRFMVENEDAKRQVIGALIYPAILMVVGILSVALLLVYVVPRFSAVFAGAGANLPTSAAFLLAFSAVLQSYGWLLLFLPVIFWYGWHKMDGTPELREKKEAVLVKIPLLGKAFLYQDFAAFSRTLSALLEAGIPLIDALHTAKGVLKHQILLNDIAKLEVEVRGGQSLGRALEGTMYFPRLMSQLVMVGEETGQVAAIIAKVGESYDKRVKELVTRIVALVEPAMILFMGLFVGGIVITMLSAVFSINDTVF